MRYLAKIGTEDFRLEVIRRGDGRYRVFLNGEERQVETRGVGGAVALSVDGRLWDASISREGSGASRNGDRSYGVAIGGRHYPVQILDPLRQATSSSGPQQSGRAEIRSTMPGRIAAVLVKEGQEIKAGQGLVVVEAMKMENEMASPKDGTVGAISVSSGDAVETGALLVTVD
jgi:biotin carboxyl carrier protein